MTVVEQVLPMKLVVAAAVVYIMVNQGAFTLIFLMVCLHISVYI